MYYEDQGVCSDLPRASTCRQHAFSQNGKDTSVDIFGFDHRGPHVYLLLAVVSLVVFISFFLS